MRQSLSDVLAQFTEPQDPKHLRLLEGAASAIIPAELTKKDVGAIFDLYERFPNEDGYGVFWSFLHAVEASCGYELALLESVGRKACEFNVMMVGRLLNAGILQIGGQDLSLVLAALAARSDISQRVSEVAKSFTAKPG